MITFVMGLVCGFALALLMMALFVLARIWLDPPFDHEERE